MKHTPGPWTIIEKQDEFGVIRVGNGTSLQAERTADVYGTNKGYVEANARLIAAAPELHTALFILSDATKRLLSKKVIGDESVQVSLSLLERALFGAEKAIAKAEGRSE